MIRVFSRVAIAELAHDVPAGEPSGMRGRVVGGDYLRDRFAGGQPTHGRALQHGVPWV
ncbi:hypothetical protein [Streptomyces sp. NPDC057623]|uniref:hypothetical protein n=1 Tax=Streptomyces sp. NPDC057623 TaxID=3346187 RepID=UPI003684C46C